MNFKEWAKSHMLENPHYYEGIDDNKYRSFWNLYCEETWEGHVNAMEYIFDQVYKDCSNGVLNYRCPNCKNIAGPIYPVNLAQELNEQQRQIDSLKQQLCFSKVISEHDKMTLDLVTKLIKLQEELKEHVKNS